MPVKKIKLPDSSVIDVNDSRIHIYRTLTGTAADTTTPYNHAKWDVTDSTITEYVDGMVVCLKVPVAGHGTYGTGFQINNLGYKPVVYNVNSMVSTRYGVGSVIWCVYNATQTGSLYINSTAAVTVTGCWQVQDYDANTNTIGYQLRTNSSTRPVSSTTYRYRLMFSSLDNSKWVPATNSTSTNATSARTVNQEVINPWGRIVYYSTTTARSANQSLSATAQWDRYVFNLGYSFNTGTALNLTFPGPVYIKCAPQAGGGAIIDSTTPYTQSLPSSADDKIYIYLGQAYSASEVELIDYHPVLYHDGTKIALWTGATAESDLFDCVMTQENNVWSCDHTWAEIYAAHQAGKLVRLIQSNGTIYMPTSIGSNSGMFSSAVTATLLSITFEAINTFYYDGEHTEYSTDWTFFNAAHPIFSFDYQTKLNGIEAGAQVNVQSDWNQSDSTADDFIKNKPTIPTTTSQLTNNSGFITANDVPQELFKCNISYQVVDGQSVYSCDKTWSEIYAAHQSGKLVVLFADSTVFTPNVIQPNGGSFESDRYSYFEGVGGAYYTFNLTYSTNEWKFIYGAGYVFSQSYKEKLDGIAAGAEVNVQADWNQSDSTADDFVKNKPSLSTVATSGSYNDLTNKPTIPDAVSGVNDGTNWTSLTIGSTTKAIPQGGGGLSDHDFTHTANTTVSTSTATVTFAANTRGSAMLTISADLGLTIACNNGSDNYIWVKNTGSSEVDITISAVTKNSTNVSNVYVPSDGISVPAGGLCEIGVIVNTYGAFLTSRNDLAL